MLSSNHKNILIIGEFPVLHKGYIAAFDKILKKTPKAHFYLGFLANQIVKELTKLEPDIRKISVRDIKKLINVCLPIKKFFLVNRSNFSRVIKNTGFHKIIILKGEKSEDFAKQYLVNDEYKKLVQFYDIRLKWKSDKVAELNKKSDKLSIAEIKKHKEIMKKVFRKTENSRCFWRQAGAALVKNKKIILTAYNKMMPTDDECYKIGCIRDNIAPGKSSEICSAVHAEASVIAQAAKQGISLKNATLYASHFPCPACAKLIALSGIEKVVYSRGHAVFDGRRVMKSKGVKLIKI